MNQRQPEESRSSEEQARSADARLEIAKLRRNLRIRLVVKISLGWLVGVSVFGAVAFGIHIFARSFRRDVFIVVAILLALATLVISIYSYLRRVRTKNYAVVLERWEQRDAKHVVLSTDKILRAPAPQKEVDLPPESKSVGEHEDRMHDKTLVLIERADRSDSDDVQQPAGAYSINPEYEHPLEILGSESELGDKLTQPKVERRPNTGDPTEFRVWFGTDRRERVAGDIASGFLDADDDVVHWGSCVVRIPKCHQFGSIGYPLIARIARKIVGKESDKPLELLAIEAGTSESVLQELNVCLGELSPEAREILLFVHGYNVTFEAAAIRAAQIGRDLAVPGPTVFYSWPSFGKVVNYPGDEATVIRSVPLFVSFLKALLALPNLRTINVLAHSMGNRLFADAATRLHDQRLPTPRHPQIGQIVLAAPDIDRKTFLAVAKTYAALRAEQCRTTVYWNHNDLAVTLSRLLHSASRVGTNASAVQDVDSILWRDKLFSLDLLGHGYFADAESVLRDIQTLLLTKRHPMMRGLKPIPNDVPQWYEFS
jgi:esterase/lipase superfamily enzyme